MKKVFLFLLTLMLLPMAASAYQPRLIDQAIVVKVANPQIAQAFLGQMTGSSVLYSFEFTEPQDLYIQLFVPKIEDIDKDVSAYLFKMVDRKEEIIARIDGKKFEWTEYYEEITNDEYWQGPELTKKLEAGSYMLRVYSPDNEGKYVLAVGQDELYPPKEIVNAVISMPNIKLYLEKPIWEAYVNVLGLYIAGSFIVFYIILTIFLKILKFIKKLFTKNKTDDSGKTKTTRKLKSIDVVASRQEKNIKNKN
jgi:hypothetical protein